MSSFPMILFGFSLATNLFLFIAICYSEPKENSYKQKDFSKNGFFANKKKGAIYLPEDEKDARINEIIAKNKAEGRDTKLEEILDQKNEE